MPKLNVYVPEPLAVRVRETGVPVSAICQRALEEEVRRAEARRLADEAVLRMADRFRAMEEANRPDDMPRESAGYAAGVHWASQVALSHELAALAGMEPAAGAGVPVSREQGELYDILAGAGLSADSETNRVLSADDPWGRGFLRACRDLWQQVQPLM